MNKTSDGEGYDVSTWRIYARMYMNTYVFGDHAKGSGCIIDNTTKHEVQLKYAAKVEAICRGYCDRAVSLFILRKLTNVDVERAERVYYDKPQLTTGKTWIDEQYSDAAFQFVYLSRKLVRRVAMVLTMCVNAYKMGIFTVDTLNTMRVYGSGPCVEGEVVRMLAFTFFGIDVPVVAYDKNDWSFLVPKEITFVHEAWNNQDVKTGESVFVSYVLEHYFTLPMSSLIDNNIPVYSIEKEYFLRGFDHKNLKDFSGVDTSCVVYCRFVYNPDTWIVAYDPWIVKSTTVAPPIVKAMKLPVVVAVRERVEERLKVLKNFNVTATAYLDIGCGDMTITNAFAAHLKVPYYKGIDVRKCDDKNFVSYPTSGTLPFPSEKFDFITVFVTLHHVKKLRRLLAEISRVLAPGGRVLIREHDASLKDLLWLEYVHLIDAYTRNVPYALYVKKHYASYNSRNHWSRMFADMGLVSDAYERYGNPNPQQLYHELFVKTGTCKSLNIISGTEYVGDIIVPVATSLYDAAISYAKKRGVGIAQIDYISKCASDEEWYNGG